MTHKMDKMICKDCKVIPGESLTTQHRLMVLDVQIKYNKFRTRTKMLQKIGWWNLKMEKQVAFKTVVMEQFIDDPYVDPSFLWEVMSSHLRISGKNVLVVSKGHAPPNKKSWW
ncbi:hypothetical protein KSP39_PZI021493 [Platanthera zijinensis]|uniref:Uncharacterized protein n=1 Tax=Platanthera zijinensis TaxID=2320716 RepID=A0AAP0AYL9_9ASPA